MRKWQCEDVRADRRLAGGRGWWWRNVWSERREGLHCMDIRSNVELLGIFQPRWEYNIQVNSVAMLIHRSSVYIYLSVGRGMAIMPYEKCSKNAVTNTHKWNDIGLVCCWALREPTQHGRTALSGQEFATPEWGIGAKDHVPELLDKIKCNMMIRADANLAGYRLQILRL